MSEGFCGECKNFEGFQEYWGTGICGVDAQRTIVTEDDTCDEFEDVNGDG